VYGVGGDIQIYSQKGDFISLLLFFLKIKKAV
jgi:hypothetical protein